jgi:hypothetical protein
MGLFADPAGPDPEIIGGYPFLSADNNPIQ